MIFCGFFYFILYFFFFQAEDGIRDIGVTGVQTCALPISFIRAEVEESAWGYEERYRQKQDIVVGVNEYVTEQVDEVEILRVDPESERQQLDRLAKFKEERDQGAVDARLEELRQACAGDANLLEPMRAALKDRASIGE